MKKELIAALFCVLITVAIYGQSTVTIYGTKNWSSYFNLLGIDGSDFYYSCTGMKDSLPDGNYFFYSYTEKDSLKKEFSRNVVSGSYLNSKKNGVFKEVEYRYNKKKKRYEEHQVTIYHYLNGKLEGCIEEFIVVNYDLYTGYIMLYYCEYKEGNKDGLEILYNTGYPSDILLYEKGVQSKCLLKRKISPD
jgi:hypothetical protein